MNYYALIENRTDAGLHEMKITDRGNKKRSMQGTIIYKENTPLMDYIEVPEKLVSDPMKEILESYQDSAPKSVIFTSPEKTRQVIYWQMTLPEPVGSIHESTVYDRSGLIEELVLNMERIKQYNFFQVNHKIQNYYIVNLPLAESLLRRQFSGFLLEEIKTADGRR